MAGYGPWGHKGTDTTEQRARVQDSGAHSTSPTWRALSFHGNGSYEASAFPERTKEQTLDWGSSCHMQPLVLQNLHYNPAPDT